MAVIDGLRQAVSLLTRIPMGPFSEHGAKRSWALAWFPVVGAGVGVLWLAWWKLFSGMPVPLRATGAIVSEILLTGGMHWDGWADVFDGWGAGPGRREQARKDSRIGAIGVLWLVAGFVAMVQLWRQGADTLRWPLLFLSPVFARGVISVATALPKASAQSQLAQWVQQMTDPRGSIISSLLTVGLSYWLIGPRALVLDAGVVLLAAMFVSYWQRIFSGLNGDILGATVIFTELAVLAVGSWSWIWR
ncbi:hypothetical protein BXT84_09190 [Sulfobacillus thermotolerans]|uniref:Adenosylcobinamide-GDP ribazoletransferase n=1 Tax=Sulfobacillus thermotolerans TaxID=338644 RepID=A0ABN5H051_9FIRM|nr:hypothetical protein BXT84_09190 [Sulfobacillus thermotolerans]